MVFVDIALKLAIWLVIPYIFKNFLRSNDKDLISDISIEC